jgi:5'-nucleotidase
VVKPFVKEITLKALENSIPENVVLNVNFPQGTETPIQGIKVCRQAKANWVEEFDKRTNPMGREYYWLTGKFVNEDRGEDTDEWALEHHYISVVPVQYDLTAHHAIQNLNTWQFE